MQVNDWYHNCSGKVRDKKVRLCCLSSIKKVHSRWSATRNHPSLVDYVPLNRLRATPVYMKQLSVLIGNCADDWRHFFFKLRKNYCGEVWDVSATSFRLQIIITIKNNTSKAQFSCSILNQNFMYFHPRFNLFFLICFSATHCGKIAHFKSTTTNYWCSDYIFFVLIPPLGRTFFAGTHNSTFIDCRLVCRHISHKSSEYICHHFIHLFFWKELLLVTDVSTSSTNSFSESRENLLVNDVLSRVRWRWLVSLAAMLLVVRLL